MSGTYYIYINGKDFEVFGVEAAWNAFRKAWDFAEAIGATAMLLDGESGEVLAVNDEEE